MTDEELKAALEKALESIGKLEKKNSELIDREKEAKKLSDEAQSKADELADEAARKAGDLESVEKRLTDKHTRAMNLLQAERDAAITARDDAVKLSADKDINDALRSAMVDNSVPKHLHAPLTAYLKSGIEMADGVATRDGKPLTEYFKTEEGKAYVVAPANVGTGSTGVRNSTADEWANPPKTPDEQFRFSKLSSEDPDRFNHLCDRFNMADRKV